MSGINIIGGRNNNTVRVTEEGLLETLTVSMDLSQYSNFSHELSFVVLDSVVPDSTSVNFFYIKNESDNLLVISATDLWCEGDEIIEIWRNPIGSPSGGSTINPANCNFGSNKFAIGTFYSGNDITGISGGQKRNRIHLVQDVQQRYYFPNFTVLERNSTLRCSAMNGGFALDFWFQFFYLPEGAKL